MGIGGAKFICNRIIYIPTAISYTVYTASVHL